MRLFCSNIKKNPEDYGLYTKADCPELISALLKDYIRERDKLTIEDVWEKITLYLK